MKIRSKVIVIGIIVFLVVGIIVTPFLVLGNYFG